MADRVTCVQRTIGDGGKTLDALAASTASVPVAVDFLFLGRDKDAYVSDLRSLLSRGWLARG